MDSVNQKIYNLFDENGLNLTSTKIANILKKDRQEIRNRIQALKKQMRLIPYKRKKKCLLYKTEDQFFLELFTKILISDLTKEMKHMLIFLFDFFLQYKESKKRRSLRKHFETSGEKVEKIFDEFLYFLLPESKRKVTIKHSQEYKKPKWRNSCGIFSDMRPLFIKFFGTEIEKNSEIIFDGTVEEYKEDRDGKKESV